MDSRKHDNVEEFKTQFDGTSQWFVMIFPGM